MLQKVTSREVLDSINNRLNNIGDISPSIEPKSENTDGQISQKDNVVYFDLYKECEAKLQAAEALAQQLKKDCQAAKDKLLQFDDLVQSQSQAGGN